MKALVHLYCGDGKGKTTASVGLAVRAAGAGKKVLFVQFFKNGSSSELRSLRKLEGIGILLCEKPYGFIWNMTPEELAAAKADFTELLREALRRAEEGTDLLILDEAVSACNCQMIPEEELCAFLQNRPENLEVVLTGRDPSEALKAQADYITEMKKIRHPFDRGIQARRGIEF
ncbi:MAG: cob(I)yrinic acid a,c-diamide adenosyltransferase [Erysipelotrichaceae bacterium]|nr:cob(I)yrinic acid a,c-diamide adenosyltransferase [Erysipelotrichaceae bacterium]